MSAEFPRPKGTSPEAMARTVGRVCHAACISLIDAGVRNGAPLVGWEATPIERSDEQLKELAEQQKVAENAMIALLWEIFGKIAFHPAFVYACAAGAIVATGYEFTPLPEQASEDSEDGTEQPQEGAGGAPATTNATQKRGSIAAGSQGTRQKHAIA